MNRPPIRLGLVGGGMWGRSLIRTIQGLDDVHLCRLASSNPASRTQVDRRCAVYTTWPEMLEAPGLDGVIVATPPPTHAHIAIAALDRDLAVLIEKPLTLDLAQAERLSDRVRQQGAIAMVDHTDLLNPAWQAVRQHLDKIGPIRSMSGAWSNWGPFRQDTSGRWDYGAHALAACIDIVGAEPSRVAARNVVCRESGELVELVLEWDDGPTATLLCGNAHDVKQRELAIHGHLGILLYDDLAEHKATLNGQPVPYSNERPLAKVVQQFASCIRNESAGMRSLELGVSVVRTLKRVDRALGTQGG